jgi:hypothetical protein
MTQVQIKQWSVSFWHTHEVIVALLFLLATPASSATLLLETAATSIYVYAQHLYTSFCWGALYLSPM